MVREQGVPIDVVELARWRMGTPLDVLGDDRRVEAKDGVEPLFDLIAERVSDRFLKLDLSKRSAQTTTRLGTRRKLGRARTRAARRRSEVVRRVGVLGQRRRPGLLPKLLDKLDGKGTTRTLVTVDGRRHKDEVGANERSNERQRDRRGLVNDNKLGLTENVSILGLDVLRR